MALDRYHGSTAGLHRRLYEIYYDNRGLLLIAASQFTGSLMLVVVKLMGNQDEESRTRERESVQVPTVQVRSKFKVSEPSDVISDPQLIALRMIVTMIVCQWWMYDLGCCYLQLCSG